MSSVEAIGLVWDALLSATDTGGSPILNYKIRWNQGSLINVFEDKETVAATGASVYAASIDSLTGGSYYQFTILAENVHGWSAESQVFTENAAAKPDKVASFTTTIEGTFIKVDWSSPFNNYREITGYRVTIKDKGTGLYVEDKSLCDGSSQEIISITECYIPFKALRLGYSAFDYEVLDVA